MMLIHYCKAETNRKKLLTSLSCLLSHEVPSIYYIFPHLVRIYQWRYVYNEDGLQLQYAPQSQIPRLSCPRIGSKTTAITSVLCILLAAVCCRWPYYSPSTTTHNHSGYHYLEQNVGHRCMYRYNHLLT